MNKRIIPVILTAALTSIITLFVAASFQDNGISLFKASPSKQLPVNYVGFDGVNRLQANTPVDFQAAAENSVKAVVHIKTTTKEQVARVRTIFGDQYGVLPPQMGSGSGVVISQDGYIVTNNHVVAGADEVTVTFNDRFTTKAKVVGTDASTDIAVLKVNENNLPFMEFGNSDEVRLGQWVLAVGYPLTLDATVTAGIVSAKSRALGINRTQSSNAIESFIQTDAAVNPGNSGGALVNMNGQLIGINSAIASPTGSYAGYSYAVPSNIVNKVVEDLVSFGSVQRAYLGIKFFDRKTLSNEDLTKYGIDRNEGVYVADVFAGSGAARAGIKTGDFITQINNVDVRTEPELQEKVAMYNPGDNISITYIRDGNQFKTSVELKKLDQNVSRLLGANIRALTAKEKKDFNIKSGLVVTDLGNGKLAKSTNMRKNFIILSANNIAVNSLDDLQKILAASDNVQLAGFYPNSRGMYYYGITTADAEGAGEQ